MPPSLGEVKEHLPRPVRRVARPVASRLRTMKANGRRARIDAELASLRQTRHDLDEVVDRLNTVVRDLDGAVARNAPGLNLPGAVSESVNPYEQELWAYQQHFALSLTDISTKLPEVRARHVDLDMDDYKEFLANYLPEHPRIAKALAHKKKLELYISYVHLPTGPGTRFLDAAGGGFSYLGHIDVADRYLQDLEIRPSVRERVGDTTTYIEESLAHIPLPDGSLDAVSCHHAFEHFQGPVDTEFIREVQRVLAVGGKAAIVPIFFSTDHVEMTNLPSFSNWSSPGVAIRVVDTTATLPGKKSGHYARIYDTDAFRTRVLDAIDLDRFDVEIVEHTLGGAPVPDPKTYASHKVSNFNFPYRALVIERTA